MNMEIIVAFGFYFTILGLIAFFAYRKSKVSSDFALGSRSLSYWVTALAAHASDMSGWLFMGFPAAIYSCGLIKSWEAIGLVLFMYLNWKFIAPKLRRMTEQYNSETIPSFLATRYADKGNTIKILSAFLTISFFTFYIAASFVALGHLFQSVFFIPYELGISLGALVIFYILLGGYISIAWVDFFQGIFLLCMILLVPAVAYWTLGGNTTIIEIAKAKNISLSFLPHSIKEFFNILILAVSWGLGYFGQPHIVTKFMGIKDIDQIKKAQYVGLAWQSITLAAAVCVGIIGIGFFPQGLVNNELIFVEMTKALFIPFIAGIILCAIIASAINVIGAQILVCASIISQDLLKSEKNSRAATLVPRISTVVICLLSLAFALFHRQESIYSLVYYAWAGLGCSFGPALLIALHTSFKSRAALLTGMLVGGATAALWPYINQTIPALPVGFALGIACMIVGEYVSSR